MSLRTLIARTGSACLILLLAACGGGGGDAPPPAVTYTIGGTVTGLSAGQQVTLLNNGGDAKVVSANAAYTFTTPVAANGSYSVTVGTQPTGQTCSVSNGAGAGVTANVTNVNVTCSAITYTIGGTVTGLAAGQQVTLLNNGGDAKVISANAAYTFATPVAANGSYSVTVGTQPTGQTCSVSNGAGAGVTANVTNANITCSAITYTIGGTVTGLAAGQQVTLLNNGGDAKIVSANAAYTFTTPVAANGSYSVTVGTQPTGQTCSVANGTGAGITANVTNANITCSTITYTVGGTVTGLAAGQQVTLLNNGGDAKIVSANAAYTFTTPVNYNGSYAVTVGTQPTGQTCSVSNGTGGSVVSNVTNANITCSTITFTIGGTVTGLAAGQQVTLLNNGGNALVVAANGAYTFTTPVAFNGSYAVTVGTQPTAQGCRVSGGTGSGIAADVTNVTVNCRAEVAYVTNSGSNNIYQYTIGADGSLSNLPGLSLGDNIVAAGQDPRGMAVDATGSFAYVANFCDGTVSQYTIGTDGSLSPMTPSATVSIGSGPSTGPCNAVVTRGSEPYSVVVHPSGPYVYVVASHDQEIFQFAIGAGGALAPLGLPIATGSGPLTITLDPSGRFAYVSNYSDAGSTISQYSIAADGSLNPLSSPTVSIGVGRQPYGVTIDPAGTYAYIGDYGRYGGIPGPNGWILQFAIGVDGALTDTGAAPVAAELEPYPVAIDPSGQFAFWSNSGSGTLSKCAIGALGALVNCTTEATATGPERMSIDPSGRYLYVANQGNSSVSQYTIGAGPSLAPIGSGPADAGGAPTFVMTTR